MITTKTKIDTDIQKELVKGLNLWSKVALIVGIIGMVAYIVLGTIFYESLWVEILLISAIPFGFGLVFLITIKKLLKKTEEVNQENAYVFEENYVNVTTYRHGDEFSTAKIYYKNLVKSKEVEKYIFLYIDKAAAMPVDKSKLSQDELVVLRSFLNLELLPQFKKGKNGTTK